VNCQVVKSFSFFFDSLQRQPGYQFIMSTPYEIEHNIRLAPLTNRRRRRPDMSTFYAHLHQITVSLASLRGADSGGDSTPHNNPHATTNPADLAAMFRLVQDQMGTLATDSPTETNSSLLRGLVQLLEFDVHSPPMVITGVTQEYLDGLDRVNRARLKADDTCPICAEKHLDDPYCLVVELPCHGSHRFDLECVGPWLLSKGTCPMCRKDLAKKKKMVVEDDEENEDPDGLYA